MDSIEPEQTPFAAVSAHTSRITRVSLDVPRWRIINMDILGWVSKDGLLMKWMS